VNHGFLAFTGTEPSSAYNYIPAHITGTIIQTVN